MWSNIKTKKSKIKGIESARHETQPSVFFSFYFFYDGSSSARIAWARSSGSTCIAWARPAGQQEARITRACTVKG